MGDRPARYPYVIDPRLTVFQNRGIFPFYSDLYYVFAADRVSYETDASGMTVRWKATMTENGEFQVEFAMKMDASGGINFYYRTVYTPEMYPWIAALSEGDMIHYYRIGDNINVVKEFSAVHLEPVQWPEGLTFTGTGTLYGQVDEAGRTWLLPFEVTDATGLKSRKELVFKTTASGVDAVEINTTDFAVYPNPARGVIHIRTTQANRIVIRNLSGEIIRIIENPDLSAGEITLPVGDYHPGIYIVEGEGVHQQYRKRVVIL
jgi:hypothetical protein